MPQNPPLQELKEQLAQSQKQLENIEKAQPDPKYLDSLEKSIAAKTEQLASIQSDIDEAEEQHKQRILEIRHNEESAERNVAQVAKDKQDELDLDINNLTNSKLALTAEVSDLDGQKVHLLKQIEELKLDLENKTRTKRNILSDLDVEIKRNQDLLAELETRFRNIDPQIDEKQAALDKITNQVNDAETEVNRSITVLQEQETLLQSKIRSLKTEVVEYERGMESKREEDRERSLNLMIREQSLDAKRRAFYEEKKDFLTEKRQFYATRSLVD